ncbi:MAG: hypothetical protein ACLSB9_36975 [Hydrogeniiclostridium mannosilyticum]
MSKNIQIKKQPSIHRRRRRVSPILLILLAALLVLIVVSVVLFLKNFSPQGQDTQGGASISSSQQSAEGTSSQSSQDPSSSVPQQEPSSSSMGGAVNVPLDKPVPKSPPVTDSYFDDAVFIGDSISEGIELYGLMDNATIVAHTGLNPQTVLSPIKKKDERL